MSYPGIRKGLPLWKTMAFTCCLCSLFIGQSWAKTPQTAKPSKRQIDQAVAKVYPALVRIYVVMNHPSGGRMRRVQGAGSGAIISKDGYVVTNHHVAGNGRRIVCNLTNDSREEIEAELIGTDPLADIAILKLKLDQRKNPKAPLPVATWGNSAQIKVGDVVLAMGSPGALSQSVTKGIVSNTALIMPRNMSGMFKLDGEDVGSVVRWIAHDAVIFGGNSGGPLVNLKGEIVGINEIGVASLGGAIPSNYARYVAEQIIKNGHVKRSWSGLEVQPRLKSSKYDKGVLVAGVIKESPADKAKLQAGDLVTSWNGKPVDVEIAEELPPFNQVVLGTPIGQKVEIKFLRDGKLQTTTLTTVARESALPKPEEIRSWGMTGRNISRMMALERKRKCKDGVLIGSLRPGGPCSEAKPAITTGDIIVKVNGKAVKNMDDLRKLTAEATKNAKTDRTPVLVEYERKTHKLMTVVKVGKEKPRDKPARARKPWPAVATQVLTRDLAKALNMKGKKGVRITKLFKDRAADKAGLKVGDILLKLDGEVIEASEPEDADVYSTMIRQYKIGTEVVLHIVRDGKAKKIKMTLEAPPTGSDRMKKYEDDDFEFTARDMSFHDRSDKKEAAVQGVLIANVVPSGWASLGGLRSGDILIEINGKKLDSVATLEKILKTTKAGKPRRLTFFVKRGIHTRYLEIEPDWDNMSK